MGASDKLAATFHPDVDAIRNDLIRLRELKRLTKPELISLIVKLERRHAQ